jgi:hypothetical protein
MWLRSSYTIVLGGLAGIHTQEDSQHTSVFPQRPGTGFRFSTSVATMLQPSASASLPSATWVDETLMTARAQKRLVAIRFGRTADPLCQQCDAALQQAADCEYLLPTLSVYTVDIDEVPDFTYMYELYDPFTIMVFHQSKPLMLDVGFGPMRKLSEALSGEPLAAPSPHAPSHGWREPIWRRSCA